MKLLLAVRTKRGGMPPIQPGLNQSYDKPPALKQTVISLDNCDIHIFVIEVATAFEIEDVAT